MNIEAMNQAIRVLEGVPAENFRMNWVLHSNANLPKLERTIDDIKPLLHTCGTSACVVGWCAADSWFRQRGAYLFNSMSNQFDQWAGEDGIQQILGLTDAQYEELIEAEHPALEGKAFSTITPADMIGVLKAMIEENQNAGA
jgi:hypothetical protein